MSGHVDWDAVRAYVHRVLADVTHTGLPVAGTPEWCQLHDDDPAKLAALVIAGSRWVLEEEIAEINWQRDALKRASIAVAQARDWAQVARRIRERDDFHREHPDLKRRTA
ncbi:MULTISPECIES: DUF2742 domain-containing protein [unclassified Gordonia (in: high G+C Gram-positive bacteria)]|uniref:DUF2742 domain-containing protein n=1 Tax=unclassified Gordonia (in: high G+C Gram-positive bacteria) TaxID=2657482 RepID=UPI00071DA42F|nr:MULTISPECIES: DUF2742 domain-containing protein [unclassified Gordonia (in: high G+C Gram-positive bacteria)]KSU59648.1 hypothetical protein AS181_06500 [Gordonia sp. SGD-V-85]SCC02665.1 Protein of unknown function [Gordonia sp. v-85]